MCQLATLFYSTTVLTQGYCRCGGCVGSDASDAAFDLSLIPWLAKIEYKSTMASSSSSYAAAAAERARRMLAGFLRMRNRQQAPNTTGGNGDRMVVCTGSLLNARFVLTAASCFCMDLLRGKCLVREASEPGPVEGVKVGWMCSTNYELENCHIL